MVYSVGRGVAQSFTATLGRMSSVFAGAGAREQLQEMRQVEAEVAEAYITAEVERAQRAQQRFTAHLRHYLAAHPELKGEMEQVLGGAAWVREATTMDTQGSHGTSKRTDIIWASEGVTGVDEGGAGAAQQRYD